VKSGARKGFEPQFTSNKDGLKMSARKKVDLHPQTATSNGNKIIHHVLKRAV
jgi:hypothetical protein